MSKQSHYDPSRFEELDQQGDPTAYVRFMDDTRRLEAARKYKETVVSLLELHPGDTVLDVGCGTGDDVLVVAQIVGEQGRVVGIDVSEVMIAEARKRSKGSPLPIELILGNAYNLDFADETFDAVRCERVFEHLDRPVDALREIARVTRSGGRVVVTASDVDSHLFDLPDQELVRKIVHADCDRRPNGWAGRKIYCQMKEIGIADVEATGIVFCTSDYDNVNHLLEIERDGQRALDAGQINEAESHRWSALLEEAKSTGHFFFSTTHFIVRGRKP
jgi:ubiquinone/menaquinone biosynthesis C-methylase UbiE